MNKPTIRKYYTVEGEKFWHYSFGGKDTSTKSIVIEGETYYNARRVD